MNLYLLLEEIGVSSFIPDCEISLVTESIENVCEGSIFVAVRGSHLDGNDFISPALERGAVCVISEMESDIERVIKTDDARLALARLCSAFYGHPHIEMKMVGITGTNGKTTVCEYLSYILNRRGIKCAAIGTLGIKDGVSSAYTGYTTPSPEILYRELRRLCDDGFSHCVMEVSSQALAQKRTDPIDFELSVFLNLGTDHLDWHGSFDEYASAKARLFSMCKTALVNADDVNASLITKNSSAQLFTFSARDRFSDFSAKDIRYRDCGTSFIFFDKKNIIPLSGTFIGEIAVYNILAALSAAELLGISPDDFPSYVKSLPRVSGRMEKTECDGKTVYVDYAHTPQALRGVLEALKSICSSRLICVFGCGGDRDKGKRPVMGSVAAKYCDLVIITNDNPRNENPGAIINDILSGIGSKRKVLVEEDRYKAIEAALKKAKRGDIVLVAGKGHEEYQLTGKEKHYFSDDKTVKKILGLE